MGQARVRTQHAARRLVAKATTFVPRPGVVAGKMGGRAGQALSLTRRFETTSRSYDSPVGPPRSYAVGTSSSGTEPRAICRPDLCG